MRVPIAGLVLTLAVGACGGAGPGGTPASAGPGLLSDYTVPGLSMSYENVILADDTVTVGGAVVRSDLQAIEPTEAGAILRFAAGSDAIRELRPGQVVAFESVGIARIDSVQTDGAQIVVETTGATLDEFIESGVLAYDAPVQFTDLPPEAYAEVTAASGVRLAAATLPRDIAAELAAQTVELVYKGKIRDFDVEWKLKPSADKVDFELVVGRSNVKITVKGFVSNFHQGTRLEYDAGAATLVESKVSGLRGEAEITWAATQVKDPRDTIVEKLNLPLAVPFPIQIGPVPMTLTFKAIVRIVPAFEHTDQGSSGGSFKLSYDSDHGFLAKTVGEISPVSRVRSFLAELGSKETVTAGLGPTGFAVGLEFPRLELSLGNPLAGGLFKTYAFLTLDQYANGQFTPGTTLTADIPPCQRADIRVSAVAGYNFEVLGLLKVADNTELWSKRTEKFLNDKPCTLTGS